MAKSSKAIPEGHACPPLDHIRNRQVNVRQNPGHHRDPFDRLLVADALAEGATILTPDPAIQRYPVSWRW
jgi:PIN domain nuclease of toxin-antitoxin system